MATPFVLAIIGLLIAVVVLFEINAVTYAYQRLGLNRDWAYGLLLASIFGSRVNVPVARWQDRRQIPGTSVRYFGVTYVMPPATRPGQTVVAVNVGGAIVPTALSVYLFVHNGLGLRCLIALAIVTVVVNRLARPVPGLGIAVPALAPAAVAVLAATVVGGHAVAAVAYVAGTLGCLVGADLLNLHKVRQLGVPIASIGGAGTFDGIFLTGIVAVILAAS
jgi:uncharacterized membrane protein